MKEIKPEPELFPEIDFDQINGGFESYLNDLKSRLNGFNDQEKDLMIVAVSELSVTLKTQKELHHQVEAIQTEMRKNGRVGGDIESEIHIALIVIAVVSLAWKLGFTKLVNGYIDRHNIRKLQQLAGLTPKEAIEYFALLEMIDKNKIATDQISEMLKKLGKSGKK